MRMRVADAGDRAEMPAFPDGWMVSDPRTTESVSRIGGEARRGRADSTRAGFLHCGGNRERRLGAAG